MAKKKQHTLNTIKIIRELWPHHTQSDVAARLGLCDSYVSRLARRDGLPPKKRGRASRPKPAPSPSAVHADRLKLIKQRHQVLSGKTLQTADAEAYMEFHARFLDEKADQQEEQSARNRDTWDYWIDNH